MFCKNCGAELAGSIAYCAKCGKATTTSQAAATGATPGAGLQSNVAGLLCYPLGFITGAFFLIAEPYKRDHFIRFHAFQSIFLSLAWMAVYFVLHLMLSMFPLMFWQVVGVLTSLISLGFLCLVVFVMYRAYSNEQFQLPMIGALAEKQA
jgi:uncharacterized membrane protein